MEPIPQLHRLGISASVHPDGSDRDDARENTSGTKAARRPAGELSIPWVRRRPGATAFSWVWTTWMIRQPQSVEHTREPAHNLNSTANR